MAMMALVLFLVIFFIPFFVREFRSSRQLTLVFWLVIIFRQIVAFTNAFLFTTIGAGGDANTFQRLGEEFAQSGEFYFVIGVKFFTSMLGLVYGLLGSSSQLLGEQLSILAFAISCVLLVKILRLFELSSYQVSVLFVFGALPSMIFLGAVTLRESFQLLFFMLAIFFGIKMHIKKGINFYFLALIISAIILGMLHKGLVVFSAFMIVLFIVWTLRPVSRLWNIKKWRLLALFVIPVFIVVFFALIKMRVAGGAVDRLYDTSIYEAISTYRADSPVTRATYDVEVDFSTHYRAIYSCLIVYVYYLFAPFPWQVMNVLDVYAFMESIFRMILLFFSLKNWRGSYGMQHRLFGLMLILFFGMTFIWAVGTTNYGTAMRHHMLTWWLLVIVGLPSLMESLDRFRLGLVLRRG